MLVARSLQKDVFSCNIVWLHFWCLTADSTQALPLPTFPFCSPFGQAGNKAQGPFLWYMQEFQTTQAQVGRQGSSEPISPSKYYTSQASLLTLFSQDTFIRLRACPVFLQKLHYVTKKNFYTLLVCMWPHQPLTYKLNSGWSQTHQWRVATAFPSERPCLLLLTSIHIWAKGAT